MKSCVSKWSVTSRTTSRTRAAFGLRVGAEIVIERVEKIMAVQFIAAGVRFPKPFAVGALGPARVHRPSTACRAVAPARSPSSRPTFGSGHSTGGWCGRYSLWVGSVRALGHLLQKAQSLERLLRARFGFRILGGRISEALPAPSTRTSVTVRSSMPYWCTSPGPAGEVSTSDSHSRRATSTLF